MSDPIAPSFDRRLTLLRPPSRVIIRENARCLCTDSLDSRLPYNQKQKKKKKRGMTENREASLRQESVAGRQSQGGGGGRRALGFGSEEGKKLEKARIPELEETLARRRGGGGGGVAGLLGAMGDEVVKKCGGNDGGGGGVGIAATIRFPKDGAESGFAVDFNGDRRFGYRESCELFVFFPSFFFLFL
ncbi:hypothetical protein EUGRSUZ_K02837 [Eucalyptus grandis]|uniref:Uncharacterized protein n=2 Tax=Eucalyptus grandis TaxID=71139 RepID=A0ACC3IYM6_EUCGR|nr:hypothetical protein EUGRSUZ_K02837 [Eucalyptus grandis]